MFNTKYTTQLITASLCLILLFSSCRKGWLDIKSDKKLVVPQTLNDFEALLNYDVLLNTTTLTSLQTLAEEGADNFFFPFNTWQSLSFPADKNAYVFATKIFEGPVALWNQHYQRVFYANIALEGVSKILPENNTIDQWHRIKGSALFIRAHSFYWLLQLFSMPYHSVNNSTIAGIPLRLNPDINELTIRNSQKECYDRLLVDLKEAAVLLPIAPSHIIKPSAAGCYALLARTYLDMHNYDSSLFYANACLNSFTGQLNFNNIANTGTYPLQNKYNEVIYTDKCAPGGIFRSMALIDTVLYNTYETGDLRKNLFFVLSSTPPYYNYKGSYEGTNLFGGIAADEILLTRAECYARKGNLAKAIVDLDALLKTRWDKNLYTTFTSNDKEAVLAKILLERRKELFFRGLRWVDLRRLNTEGHNINVTRNLNGNIYRLLPNSLNYAFNIPDNVIELTGIVQNLRN